MFSFIYTESRKDELTEIDSRTMAARGCSWGKRIDAHTMSNVNVNTYNVHTLSHVTCIMYTGMYISNVQRVDYN